MSTSVLNYTVLICGPVKSFVLCTSQYPEARHAEMQNPRKSLSLPKLAEIIFFT